MFRCAWFPCWAPQRGEVAVTELHQPTYQLRSLYRQKRSLAAGGRKDWELLLKGCFYQLMFRWNSESPSPSDVHVAVSCMSKQENLLMELCQWCVYMWSHSRTPEHLLFVFEIFHQRQEFLICNIIILVLPTVSRGVFKALDQILGLNKIAKLTVSYSWISFSVKCLVIIPQWCPVTHTQARMSTSTEAWPECWMPDF